MGCGSEGLPRAGWAWTIAPQLLVGAGIGLALAALTERAVAGRAEQVVHGGWTLAARHAGVVLGLLLLAPMLTAALDRNEDEALRAGVAEVLDSRIPAIEKLRLAQDVLDQVDSAGGNGELPDVGAAFEDRPSSQEYRDLLSGLDAPAPARRDQRVLWGVPARGCPGAGGARARGSRSRRAAVRQATPLYAAIAAVAAVVFPYVALGSASGRPRLGSRSLRRA